MEQIFVGIDVAKDRLDSHVLPSGEAFAGARAGEGLAALVERLKTLKPTLVVRRAGRVVCIHQRSYGADARRAC